MVADPLKQLVESKTGVAAPRRDIEAVLRRGLSLRLRRRVALGTLLAVSTVATAALAISVSDVTDSFRGDIKPLSTVVEDPPEGKFLLQIGNRARVDQSRAEDMTVGVGVTPYDTSTDGQRIVATTPRADVGGQTRETRLVVIDVSSRRETVIANARPDQSLGPAAWSPDATRVAYRYGSVNTASPTATEQSVCVVIVDVRDERCFQDAGIGPVNSFDWSPDSRRLVLSGFGRDPIRVLDAVTGTQSVLVPSGGNESIRRGFKEAGLGDPEFFSQPAWSPTGNHIALTAFVNSTGSVPLVVDEQGAFVALGRPNPNPQLLAWSTTRDVLAYTMGVLVPEAHPGQNSGVRLLDPVTGDDRLLVDTTAHQDPYIASLVWSPDGRWLALGNQHVIRIEDVLGGEPQQVMSVETQDVPDALRDWSL